MSRTPLPLHAEDISAFARSLGGQLKACESAPGHLQLLNMLARSAGFRNFQHLRADAMPPIQPATIAAPPQPAAEVSEQRLRRLVRLFDAEGRLARWPSKRGMECACLWVVWSRVEPRRVYGERELNERLAAVHTFGDAALLRRGMCDMGLMTRTRDGREYRRVEAKPAAEALALMERLRGGRE
jgi:hypothetical protein